MKISEMHDQKRNSWLRSQIKVVLWEHNMIRDIIRVIGQRHDKKRSWQRLNLFFAARNDHKCQRESHLPSLVTLRCTFLISCFFDFIWICQKKHTVNVYLSTLCQPLSQVTHMAHRALFVLPFPQEVHTLLVAIEH